MEVLSQDNWTSEVTNELRKFEKSLIIALKEKGWDGNEAEDTVTWTFAGGLFYSITVITTIGKKYWMEILFDREKFDNSSSMEFRNQGSILYFTPSH
jgi:hypothetical protein